MNTNTPRHIIRGHLIVDGVTYYFGVQCLLQYSQGRFFCTLGPRFPPSPIQQGPTPIMMESKRGVWVMCVAIT